MDRSQLLLVGLPMFLLFSDVINLFAISPPPPKPTNPNVHQFHPKSNQDHRPLQFPTQKSGGIGAIGGVGIGNTVNIDFCASCSYRGTAINMKNMLEHEFPGINVILANYPPTLPKRFLSKVVPVVQFGFMGIIMAGEQIFQRLGMAAPPPWYHALRANRFRSIATAWLFGNFIQNFLQSSGAFEVYCNGDLVFSKLMMNSFPGEIELRDLVGKKIANERFVPSGTRKQAL